MLRTLFNLMLALIIPMHAYAWDSYRADNYNSGYSQSWEQYKVDNKIETKSQPTFWCNVGSWFSNVYESVSNAISNFVDSVKSYFTPKEQNVDINLPELEQYNMNTKTIEVNLQEQTSSELEQQSVRFEEEQTKENVLTVDSDGTEKEQLVNTTDYVSVAAGAYKTNVEFDEYTLRPEGAKENDIAFSKLPEDIKQMVPIFENAVERIQNNENMVMVLLQTSTKIQDITLKGEQIRTLLCRINEGLLNHQEVNLLTNVNTITKQGNDLTINLKNELNHNYSNPALLKGREIKITIPQNFNITPNQENSVVNYNISNGGFKTRVKFISANITGVKVDENNSVYLKYKLYNRIPREKQIYNGESNGTNERYTINDIRIFC